jgi:hypothetical protein
MTQRIIAASLTAARLPKSDRSPAGIEGLKVFLARRQVNSLPGRAVSWPSNSIRRGLSDLGKGVCYVLRLEVNSKLGSIDPCSI